MVMEPTEADLTAPDFEAVWNLIKGWDIGKRDAGGAFCYAGATGTDVMTILEALGLR